MNKLFHQLFAAEDENQNRVSWFKETLVDKFRHDKYRYKEGFQVDGFIEKILPDVHQQFQRRYESTDGQTKTDRYFDQALALDADPEEIIKLLALIKAEISSAVVTASPHLPPTPKTDQSIGAANLLKKDIKTFLLPGPIGEFLGQLERNMLAIAMVGNAGAGKSTMTMAIARAFDLAGYRIIFYSLEIGMGKPLQDMIKRDPLSN